MAHIGWTDRTLPAVPRCACAMEATPSFLVRKRSSFGRMARKMMRASWGRKACRMALTAALAKGRKR